MAQALKLFYHSASYVRTKWWNKYRKFCNNSNVSEVALITHDKTSILKKQVKHFFDSLISS